MECRTLSHAVLSGMQACEQALFSISSIRVHLAQRARRSYSSCGSYLDRHCDIFRCCPKTKQTRRRPSHRSIFSHQERQSYTSVRRPGRRDSAMHACFRLYWEVDKVRSNVHCSSRFSSDQFDAALPSKGSLPSFKRPQSCPPPKIAARSRAVPRAILLHYLDILQG